MQTAIFHPRPNQKRQGLPPLARKPNLHKKQAIDDVVLRRLQIAKQVDGENALPRWVRDEDTDEIWAPMTPSST